MENMPIEQIKDTEKQVKQGNQINTINEVNEIEEQPWENENVTGDETLDLETEAKELKDEISRKILQIKFSNIDDTERLSQLRTDKKRKKTSWKS